MILVRFHSIIRAKVRPTRKVRNRNLVRAQKLPFRQAKRRRLHGREGNGIYIDDRAHESRRRRCDGTPGQRR